ncbi:MAG: hypothetical protein EB034_17860, partial [Verrucomicrobia bacterium]|nr:hypothetical protein [Verrucomicrobiota bacterium]
ARSTHPASQLTEQQLGCRLHTVVQQFALEQPRVACTCRQLPPVADPHTCAWAVPAPTRMARIAARGIIVRV